MTEPAQLPGPIVCRDQTEAQQYLRARAEQLAIPRLVLDDLACLTDGYSAKLLSNPPTKGMSLMSLWSLAGALGLAIAFVEDERRVVALKEVKRRVRPYVLSRQWRNAKALGMLNVTAKANGEIGGKKRFQQMTRRQLREHQRRAARMRWRKWRRARKLERNGKCA